MKLIRKLKTLRKSPAEKEMEVLINRGLRLGKNVHIYSECPFDSAWPWLISVGDNSTISTNVKILAHDASTSLLGLGVKIGRVDIGKNVFIGNGCTVLCGVKIGDNSIIGAGSVVSKDVKPDSVYAGVPARYICSIEEYKEKLRNSVVCDQHRWNEWLNAPDEDKEKMREMLKDGVGFAR